MDSPYDVAVSQLLKEYGLCKEFQCLARTGGLYDQDPYWVECMDIISTEIKAYEAEQMKKR